MRIFLMLLVFAIGFSGYSAVAHAFTDISCNPAMVSEHADSAQDHHQAGKDSSSAKGVCLDCHHCCASLAVGVYPVSFAPLRNAVLNAPPVDVYHGGIQFSLLRPPRLLV